MMNIPTYRAKRSNSAEFVEGYLFKIWDNYYIQWGTKNNVPNQIEVDPTTLGIHFPNMVDKNGKKIFASLSEDGVGGDEFNFSDTDTGYICIFYNGTICWTTENSRHMPTPLTWEGDYGSGIEESYPYGIEVIGIKDKQWVETSSNNYAK